MTDFKALHRRFQDDPSFHYLVKSLYKIIDDLQLSPNEIREAAMFACYMHEMENPRPIRVGPIDWDAPANPRSRI